MELKPCHRCPMDLFVTLQIDAKLGTAGNSNAYGTPKRSVSIFLLLQRWRRTTSCPRSARRLCRKVLVRTRALQPQRWFRPVEIRRIQGIISGNLETILETWNEYFSE